MSVPGSRSYSGSLVGDGESRAWLQRLSSDGPTRDRAVLELYELLLRAARFEVRRRSAGMPHLRGGDHDDVAQQSADDALVAILAKLDSFRGDSRFTTWAYKFALLEAGVRLRRLAWQGREIPQEAETWSVIADPGGEPPAEAENRELIGALSHAIAHELTSHQREVLVAITLNDVPIDVLAERLGTCALRFTRPRTTPGAGCGRTSLTRGLNSARWATVGQHEAGRFRSGAPGSHPRAGRPGGSATSECFDSLDRYVELELEGADADAVIPGLRAHLQGCSACREDHDSLLAYLRRTAG